jgi:hypothetical protein
MMDISLVMLTRCISGHPIWWLHFPSEILRSFRLSSTSCHSLPTIRARRSQTNLGTRWKNSSEIPHQTKSLTHGTVFHSLMRRPISARYQSQPRGSTRILRRCPLQMRGRHIHWITITWQVTRTIPQYGTRHMSLAKLQILSLSGPVFNLFRNMASLRSRQVRYRWPIPHLWQIRLPWQTSLLWQILLPWQHLPIWPTT